MERVILDPLVPLPALAVVAAVAALVVVLALWRGLPGWWLRALAALALIAAIANPSWQREDRQPLSDIVIAVVDQSASQRVADRPQQTAEALEDLRGRIEGIDNTELRVVTVGDAEGDGGTQAMTALAQALAEEPRGRVAGAFLISDGQVHDLDRTPDMPAPMHALLTGQPEDWDRRLVVTNAPAFAILGEEITLRLRIENQGAAPGAETVDLQVAVGGGDPREFRVPVGEDLELPLTLTRGGMNVVRFTTPLAEGELTDRNNAAVVQINGVRDRLRVLLVSGEPHAGERTWRNLLKSDSSVDLVHFTILRPPEKQDGVPVSELSLIAFPTRELFLEKIDEFDLIVFDRYRLRGILPSLYIDNIRAYVEGGGAILVAAGPDFASASSLARSPLGAILPAEPTGRVYERGFSPELTEVGHRHPVTAGLPGGGRPATETDAAEPAAWGRWFRHIELRPTAGQVAMEGVEGAPLLVLDRVGEGRVALLGSDHAWLWSRGYEGGGPQLDLLRRIAHWTMREPELDEEALTARAEGLTMTVERRTLDDDAAPVTVTQPDGETVEMALEEVAPGRFQATYVAPEIGLYRLADDTLDAVVALGPAAPREFEQTVASGEALNPVLARSGGGARALSDGMPALRTVREGRPAEGRGWLGITPRGAYRTAEVTVFPLVPAWLFLTLAALLSLGAWLREGRR